MGNTASFSGGESGPQKEGKGPEGGKLLHREDLERAYGAAFLPLALPRKYPNAERELGWQ